MKNLFFSGSKGIFIILFVFLGSFLFTNSFAQRYGKMKISLDDGTTIDGKKGNITTESASCMVNGQLQTYSLGDVQSISTRKGSAIKWAAGTGGCCLGLFVVSGIGVGADYWDENDVAVGDYILGSAFLTVVGAGLGYLVGTLTDPWTNVYLARKSAILKKMNFQLNLDREGRPLIGLSYRF